MKWLWVLILSWFTSVNRNLIDPLVGYVVPTITNYPPRGLPNGREFQITNLPTPTQKIILKPKPTAIGDTSPWGIANQVGENTWTMKVANDERMGTPSEILDALNKYRVRRGAQELTMDGKLQDYAQSRADYLASIKTTDGHKGFNNFLENEDGFEKLGFTWLGENISYGYKMEGVHLIEWIYAGDKPHDDNQVNSRWNYVGIGVKDTATCLIFGTGKK